jgi:hypothetical protein
MVNVRDYAYVAYVLFVARQPDYFWHLPESWHCFDPRGRFFYVSRVF